MAGGARRWAANLSDESKKSTLRHAMEHGAEGLLDAREDIRQKLVDEAWFGRSTVSRDAQQSGMNLSPNNDAPAQGQDAHAGTVWESGARHNQDLHDNPNWDNVRDVAQQDAQTDALGHTAEQSTEWAGHKTRAEDLYGHTAPTTEEDREFYGNGPERSDREPDIEP